MEVRHLCGKAICVNPHHLCWGTRAENERDKLLHGTHNAGERNGRAKLTVAQVREIRRRYATEAVTQTALAREYGVHSSMVSEIVNGIRWSTVT